ncbi:MAG: YCF48-related protein [Azoarcus sp.]|nr:YCF48-related protein [Azoarcus sp.]
MTHIPLATLVAAAVLVATAGAGAGIATRDAPPIDLLQTAAPQSPRAADQLMTSLVHAGTRLVAAGARGTIVYSDDGGLHWQQAAVPVAVMLTALHFPTAKEGWAVGHDGIILHSADAGATWSRQFDGNQANTQMLEWARTRVAAARDALERIGKGDRRAAEDTLAAAEDGLAGIEQTVSFGPSQPFMQVWFRDRRHGYAVGAFGMAFATTDGGATWTLIADRLPNPDELHLYAIASPSPEVLLIAGERGLILRSTDGGQHWQARHDLAAGGLYGLIALPQANAGMLAYGFDGIVLRSTDLGNSWHTVDTGTRSALYGAAVSGEEVLLVGNNGTRLRAVDAHFEPLPASDGRPLTAAAHGAAGWVLAGGGGVAATAGTPPMGVERDE